MARAAQPQSNAAGLGRAQAKPGRGRGPGAVGALSCVLPVPCECVFSAFARRVRDPEGAAATADRGVGPGPPQRRPGGPERKREERGDKGGGSRARARSSGPASGSSGSTRCARGIAGPRSRTWTGRPGSPAGPRCWKFARPTAAARRGRRWSTRWPSLFGGPAVAGTASSRELVRWRDNGRRRKRDLERARTRGAKNGREGGGVRSGGQRTVGRSGGQEAERGVTNAERPLRCALPGGFRWAIGRRLNCPPESTGEGAPPKGPS